MKTTKPWTRDDLPLVRFLGPHGSPGTYLARRVDTDEIGWAYTLSTYRLIDGLPHANPPQRAAWEPLSDADVQDGTVAALASLGWIAAP